MSQSPDEAPDRGHRLVVLAGPTAVGKVRARQIMEEIGISESRRVRGLGNNQIAALLERFADAS